MVTVPSVQKPYKEAVAHIALKYGHIHDLNRGYKPPWTPTNNYVTLIAFLYSKEPDTVKDDIVKWQEDYISSGESCKGKLMFGATESKLHNIVSDPTRKSDYMGDGWTVYPVKCTKCGVKGYQ